MIQKRGSYYSYGETRLGQGREKAKAYLKLNPELAEELEKNIRSISDQQEEEEVL
ncbi:MAG: hypothetical protein ACERK1_11700 [Anaerolineales bacterium]